MRPIQFSQDKLKWEWKYLNASPNTSDIVYKVREAKAKRQVSSTSKSVKKRVATLLTEYYSILFNPAYRNYFRPLTDLTLLFPTNESISISNDTNFILLPLPLPTYRQHVNWLHNSSPFKLSHPCPFIMHTPQANELVHDMDYYQDNKRVMKPRTPQDRNIIYYWIQHTNPDIKRQWLEEPLDITARIRVYKFDDLFPNQAKQLPNFPKYSKSEIHTSNVIPASPLQKPGMSEEEFKKRIRNPNSYQQAIIYNQSMHRQYTFLEITPINMIADISCNNKLQVLSKYLEPSQLTSQFADCFDFNNVPKEIIINYFMDNMDWIEYSPTQIKSGIKRLKNIIKYMKPKTEHLSSPIRRTNDDDYLQSKVKFNQHIHTLNIKQADWTYSTQVIEDTKIINKTSANNIKPLSVNDLPSWQSQQ